jgi:hypothetical protein
MILQILTMQNFLNYDIINFLLQGSKLNTQNL